MAEDDFRFDAAMMGKLSGAVSFLVGADHATTKALKAAAASGDDKDIKTARTQFLRLKPADRRAALAMLRDD